MSQDINNVMQAAERLRRWDTAKPGEEWPMHLEVWPAPTKEESIYLARKDTATLTDFALSILPKGKRPVAMVGDCAGFVGGCDETLTASLVTRAGNVVVGTYDGVTFNGKPMGYQHHNCGEEIFQAEDDAMVAAYLSELERLIELRQQLEPAAR